MPLPLDPIKREIYLTNLCERFAAFSLLRAERRKYSEASKINDWIDKAPLCKCGCGSKVQVKLVNYDKTHI